MSDQWHWILVLNVENLYTVSICSLTPTTMYKKYDMHIRRWSVWIAYTQAQFLVTHLFLAGDSGCGKIQWQVAGLGLCVSVAIYMNVHYYQYLCCHYHYHYYAWQSYFKPLTCLLKLLHRVHYESVIALVVEKKNTVCHPWGNWFHSHPMVVPINISSFNTHHCWKLPTLLCSMHAC